MFSVSPRTDGFGGQFQTIVNAICIIEENNFGKYIHVPICEIEHNYDNDPNFLDKIEEIMNLKKYYTPTEIPDCITLIHPTECIRLFDHHLNHYANSKTMNKLKQIFWENKSKSNYDKNNYNVAVHIRRPNKCDNRIAGSDTELKYYIDKMKIVFEKQPNSLFYIFSQNSDDNYQEIPSYMKVVFCIDKPLDETFISLVGADALIMSKSSLSYTAALLSDGEIYYNPFWHPPLDKWN